MKSTTLALLSVLGRASAQGVTAQISPPGGIPAGCSTSFNGQFELSVLNVTVSKRDLAVAKRAACSTDGILVATLANSQILDAKDRTGYIAANFQFQFDAPPQTGAIYTAGWSVCSNGSLALGPSAIFYQCKSGDFFNLYDRSWAPQCSPVQLAVMSCGGAADPPASQIGDGQVVGTSMSATTVVVPLTDGQPQVITTQVPVPLCQITDGQLQAHTTPCASVTTTPTLVPVSQFTDGQIQVTTAIPISEHSDGQVQATTAKPTTASTAAPVSEHSDGQVQATTASAPKTTQAPSPSANVTHSATPAPSTTAAPVSGAGLVRVGSVVALAVGILGAVWVL